MERNIRPIYVYYLYLFLSVSVLFALFHRQIIQYEEVDGFGIRVQNQLYERGDIYFTDRNGKLHLVAVTHNGYDLAISPRDLGDIPETYEHINSIVEIDEESFVKSANKENDEWELILERISDEQAEEFFKVINRFSLDGVFLQRNSWREYPNGDIGSHLIGFLSFNDKGVFKGQYGIENRYNSVLSQKEKELISKRELYLRAIGGLLGDKTGGTDLVTSIDINVQKELQIQLNAIQNRWNSRKTGGVVIDPNTGNVVALAAVPDFDLNYFNKEKSPLIFSNPIVEDVYEFGSVLKPITIAIGLDSRSITLNETYNDEGFLEVDDRTIYNYDRKGRGLNIGLQTILNQSLNTGAAHVLLKTGAKTYRNYLSSFELDEPTGIDLPYEIGGLIENLDSNRTIEFVTASYGHGIAITPIGATVLFSSLANGGYKIKPRIVIGQNKESVNPDPVNKFNRFKVFEEKTTREITELLTNAYDSAGGAYRNPNYKVAAKTGTALLLNQETGGYYEDLTFHSYFGYFPASNPKFLILLFTVDPNAEFAAETLVTPFSRLVNFIAKEYALTPDR